jgi:molybdopterin-guanine dinucleotide biosynthesis protein A
VTWVREEPVGSGPAAAVGAALPLANDASVALLAADLPFLTTEAIDELLKRHASEQTPGVVALDETGREQWLISVWRTTELRAVRFVPGGSLRAVLAPLQPARVSIGGRTGMDCDTRQDLQRARELA